MLDPNHKWNADFKPTIIGFVTSIGIILAVYFVAINSDLPNSHLIFIVLGMAIVQAIIQFVFFFHLGVESKPRWNLMTFFFMVMVITIIIGGSMWIMNNIDYNLMPMTKH